MTRAEQISEYANSFNGKGVESEELKEIIRLAIIDGAKWADNHPIKPSLPSNLDEVARFGGLNYVDTIPEGGTDMHPWNDTDVERAYEEGMKAGAGWMAGQGGSYEQGVFLFQGRPMLTGRIGDCVDALEKAGAKSGDKVIVQIRKK